MTTLATPTTTKHEPRCDGAPSGGGNEVTAAQTAERYTLAAAGAVIVALTAGAFWLSYAHLAEVAGRHGLAASPSASGPGPRPWTRSSSPASF